MADEGKALHGGDSKKEVTVTNDVQSTPVTPVKQEVTLANNFQPNTVRKPPVR